jgi:penicillin-binding protein 1A
MDSMLRDVVRAGTGYKAMALKRTDLAGKTGTTNDSMDAWFAGYQPKLVGIAWMGYDQPRSLGDRETGGGLALPIWVNYMGKALKDQPMIARTVPEGMIEVNGEYYYKEYPPGGVVREVGLGGSALTPDEEKARNEVKNELF